MDFFILLIQILVNYGIAIGVSIYLGELALNRRSSKKEFAITFSILYIFFLIPYILQIRNAALLAYLFQVVVLAILLAYYSKESILKCIGVSGISFIFTYMFIKSFFITGSQSVFNQLVITDTIDVMSILLSLAGDAALLLFLFIIKRRNVSLWFKRLYSNNNLFVTIVIFLFICIWLGVMLEISNHASVASEVYEKLYMLTLVTFLGGILVLLIILVVYYRNESKNELIRMQESMLTQQKIYILNLETLEAEIKKFQHDYKNIVAGLYVEGDNGNNRSTLKFIEKNIFNFKNSLHDSHRETMYLSKIKIDEIKGVLLTKVIKCKEDGIKFQLEAFNDVNNVFIDIVDFNRCLGILMDNGMEAAVKSDGKEVRVVMIQDDNKFVLIVKNNYMGEVSLKNIWDRGYSTKGEKRGIGLSNYESILNKFPNVVKETKIENEYFIQVIKVYNESVNMI